MSSLFRGFLPPIIIRFSRDRVHGVLGAAHWGSAKLSRSLLKSFFEKGDQPQAQFARLIDSMANLIEDRELAGLRNFLLKTRHDTMKNSIGNIR